MDNTGSFTSESPAQIVGDLFRNLGKSPGHRNKETEHRRHPRTSYMRNVSLSAKRLGKNVVARAFDLSRTGICVEIKNGPMLEMGSDVVVKLAKFEKLIGSIALDGPHKIKAVVVRSWRLDADTWVYGLRFANLLEERKKINSQKIQRFLSVSLVLIGIAIILSLKISDLRWFWYAPVYRIYGILGGVFFLSRALLSLVYREPKDAGYLPPVTVVISVKNEEAHIAETVKRVFDVRYPLHKLELIVIDDGSTDNTWAALQKVQPEYPRLRLFQFPTNLGKRHGMALGAREATGEILVYVDSDSYVEAEGIYRLVQPFADRRIGAVAGHTRVIIEKKNPISKMESVRYFISHQFFKTAESVFGTVTCCPGAFSAYRRSAVLRVLPKWLDQTFLGVKSTFGDDRSLTNFVLRTHRVVYHAGAICVTYVPTTWKQFFTQQLRWKKSWAREATVASRVMLKKHPVAVISFYLSTVITFLSPLIFLRAVVIGPLLYSQSCVPYLLGLLLVYLFLCLFFLCQTNEKHWYYGLLFAASYLTILCWQTYWATCTINKTQWGTR